MSGTLLEERVQESLDRSLVTFNEGQAEFFDEFAKDATIFTVDSGEPIKGREAYRDSYMSALTSQKREKTILGRNLQVVGDKAVVTQTARIVESNSVVDVSQTIVYGLTEEGVKVLHMHTSLLRPGNEVSSGSPIKIVNERIAPVAEVLGVAQ